MLSNVHTITDTKDAHLHLALEHIAGRQGMAVLAVLAIGTLPEPAEQIE